GEPNARGRDNLGIAPGCTDAPVKAIPFLVRPPLSSCGRAVAAWSHTRTTRDGRGTLPRVARSRDYPEIVGMDAQRIAQVPPGDAEQLLDALHRDAHRRGDVGDGHPVLPLEDEC